MLRFFRHIRQKLFLEGRVSRYLGYALGEIFLIVLGILIAVQIGKWNQSSNDHAEETQILLRLKPEFELNQKDVRRLIESNQKVAADMETFVKIIKPEPDSQPKELIFDCLISLGQNRRYTPNSGEISSLINSGKIALIRNPKLSVALNRWPRRVDSIEKIFDFMFNAMDRFPVQSEYFRKSDVENRRNDNIFEKSDFTTDFNKLLSSPVMEDLAATRWRFANIIGANLENTLELQQEILDLIDAELEERGVDSD